MKEFGKNLIRSAKNYTKRYNEIQKQVRAATSNNPIGPNGSVMNQIAESTYDPQRVVEILDIIHKRLNDSGKNWRHVFKSLILLDYLLRTGSETVVSYAQSNKYIIKTLIYFEHIDEYGRDQGANVRQKSKDITYLLEDRDRLNRERKQHKKFKATAGSDFRFAGSGSCSLKSMEDRDLSRAIDESKRSFYLDQKNRERLNSGNAGASSQRDGESIADLIESGRDLSDKLQKQEKEQIELYQKIVAERDSLIRENHPLGPEYYFSQQQQQQQQDLMNYAPHIPELAPSRTATLPPPQQPDHKYQLDPNFLTMRQPTYQNQVPSSFHTIGSSAQASLSPSLAWNKQLSSPPDEHLSSYPPNPDAFIDPFESLAKNAQESLSENKPDAQGTLQDTTTIPYMNYVRDPISTDPSITYAPASSGLYKSSAPPALAPADTRYNAALPNKASTSSQNLLNTTIEDLIPRNDNNHILSSRNTTVSPNSTHNKLDPSIYTQPTHNTASTSMYNTIAVDALVPKAQVSLGGFSQPASLSNKLPGSTPTAGLPSSLLEDQTPGYIPLNLQIKPFDTVAPHATIPSAINPVSTGAPTSVSFPEIQALHQAKPPNADFQMPALVNRLADPLTNNVLHLADPLTNNIQHNNIQHNNIRINDPANSYQPLYNTPVATAPPQTQPSSSFYTYPHCPNYLSNLSSGNIIPQRRDPDPTAQIPFPSIQHQLYHPTNPDVDNRI